jgi:hypothetical protein
VMGFDHCKGDLSIASFVLFPLQFSLQTTSSAFNMRNYLFI